MKTTVFTGVDSVGKVNTTKWKLLPKNLRYGGSYETHSINSLVELHKIMVEVAKDDRKFLVTRPYKNAKGEYVAKSEKTEDSSEKTEDSSADVLTKENFLEPTIFTIDNDTIKDFDPTMIGGWCEEFQDVNYIQSRSSSNVLCQVTKTVNPNLHKTHTHFLINSGSENIKSFMTYLIAKAVLNNYFTIENGKLNTPLDIHMFSERSIIYEIDADMEIIDHQKGYDAIALDELPKDYEAVIADADAILKPLGYKGSLSKLERSGESGADSFEQAINIAEYAEYAEQIKGKLKAMVGNIDADLEYNDYLKLYTIASTVDAKEEAHELFKGSDKFYDYAVVKHDLDRATKGYYSVGAFVNLIKKLTDDDNYKLKQVLPKNRPSLYQLPSGKHIILREDFSLVSDEITSTALVGFVLENGVPYKSVKGKTVPMYSGRVTGLETKLDYFQSEHKTCKIIDGVLRVTTNPMVMWDANPTLNQEIIDDYEKILNYKLTDLIKLLVLSLKYKEDKLIRLLIVGDSNKGKTKFTELLHAKKIDCDTMFVPMMKEGGKMSKQVYKAVCETGLMCVDEANRFMPDSVKSLTRESEVTVIYEGAGKTMPLDFVFLTSTHAEILEPLNIEWENRLMVVDVNGDEEYDFTVSKVKEKYHDTYEKQCELYIKKRMIEIFNADSEYSDLKALQKEYKFDSSTNVRSEVVSEATDAVALHLLAHLNSQGVEITYKDDKMYVKTKKEVKAFVVDTLRDATTDYIHNEKNAISKICGHFISSQRFKVDEYRQYELKNIVRDALDDF